MPLFSIPVPASCQIMLEHCADTFLGHGRQEDGEMLSFHYFHPDVEEALKYPKLPIPATGRTSLEWYQVLAMRYRNPELIPVSEPVDVWDVLRNSEENEFMDQDDYKTILQTIENNLHSKGSGKRNINMGYSERSAVARAAAAGDITLRSTDSSARSAMDPNPSSHGDIVIPPEHPLWDVARAHAAEMRTWPINNPHAKAPPPYIRPTVHAYLTEATDKGKGKGEIILHREPWNRRARRVYRGEERARSRSGSPSSPVHSSMPELEAPDNGVQEIIEA